MYGRADATHARDAHPASSSGAQIQHASFGHAQVSQDARSIADWVARTRDNGNAPFLIVDKKSARLLVFDSDARLVANSTVLLGFARGDDTVSGIAQKKLADIKPSERTTPAGRFVAEEGRNLEHERIIWIDYDAAVSMHRVRTNNPRERRLERLASSKLEDKRISWGCINVPAAFFDAHVSPVFSHGKRAVVYVLPEVRSLAHAFPAYAAHAHPDGASRIAVEGTAQRSPLAR
jgi:hypothetical protein